MKFPPSIILEGKIVGNSREKKEESQSLVTYSASLFLTYDLAPFRGKQKITINGTNSASVALDAPLSRTKFMKSGHPG